MSNKIDPNFCNGFDAMDPSPSGLLVRRAPLRAKKKFQIPIISFSENEMNPEEFVPINVIFMYVCMYVCPTWAIAPLFATIENAVQIFAKKYSTGERRNEFSSPI